MNVRFDVRLTGAIGDCYRTPMFYEDVFAAFQAGDVRYLIVGAFAMNLLDVLERIKTLQAKEDHG